MVQKRTGFMVSRAFRTFLVAAIFTSIANQICGTTDAILMSNIISPNAMSAINLCMPVFSLFIGIIPLFLTGATMLAAMAIGNQDSVKSRQVYTVAMTSIVSVTVLVQVLGLVFINPLVHFVCPDDTLFPLAYDYALYWLIGLIATSVTSVLAAFAGVDGQPKLCSISVIVSSVLNIILDIVLVKYLNMGIGGAAIASALSQVGSIVVLLTHFIRPTSSFHLAACGDVFREQLKENLKVGAPFALNTVIFSVVGYLSNMIVLKACGTNGMFIISLCGQITMLSMMALTGASESIFSIGGVLIGEGDMEGLTTLFKKAMSYMTITLSIFAVFVLIWPTLLARLFGADSEELLAEAEFPIRLYILSLILIAWHMITRATYQLLGYASLAVRLVFIYSFIGLAAMYLLSLISPSAIWWYFLVQAVLILAVQFAITWRMHKKDPYLSPISLISQLPNDPNINFSVGYSEEEVATALNELQSFLDICELSPRLNYQIRLCCEELMYNIVKYGNMKSNDWFDIHVTEKEDALLVVLKDCGKAFNPVEMTKRKAEEAEAMKDSDEPIVAGLGLRLVAKATQNITYKFINGQNVVFMNWKKE